MAAMEAIIIASCLGLSGNQRDACVKALEAGSKQTGVEQKVNNIEDKVSKTADKDARAIVGDTGMEVGASVGFIAKAAIEKSATFRFPVFRPAMYLNTQIGVEKSTLGLEWKF